MKTISVVVPEHCFASSVTGPVDIFNVANSVWRVMAGDKPVDDIFRCQVITLNDQPVISSSGLAIAPNAKLADIDNSDVVFLAAQHFSSEKKLIDHTHNMRPIYPILRQLAAKNKHIAAYCSSTFLLAESGLLDKQSATTSWWLTKLFAKRYPAITLTLEQLVVKAGCIWSAGATTAHLSLCLKLIETLSDPELALNVARVMLMDTNRLSQLPYMGVQTPISHHDKTIADCQRWLSDNLEKSLSVEDMADFCAMSSRNFIRRFKKAEGMTPATYLQKMRVDAARRYLESSQLRFEQIVEKVGYEDVNAFRRVFIKQTQMSPKDYRNKFSLTG